MTTNHCDDLAARFERMSAQGLLDVKFFVRNSEEATSEVLCNEVNRLYAAVERGEDTILDFKDSNRS